MMARGVARVILVAVGATLALAPQGASRADELPGYGLPAYAAGDLELRPTLFLGLAAFAESNPWYGESEANIGGDADDWIEAAFEAGLDGNLGLNDYGALYGRFSVVGTATRGGID
ncbi:MAG TPA: hypothetical protein VFG47_01460, partial [Geminicoccaceae bacterium]|nr:hypothetical protein [Geminicoccaceae bacterium]